MFTIHTYQCPVYLTDSVHPYSSNDPARYRLCSAMGTNYSVPRNLATELSLWPGQSCGTVCHQQFVTQSVCSLLSADSNQIISIPISIPINGNNTGVGGVVSF